MKFSIRKLQSGGGMPPFTYYQPVMVNNSSTASTTAAQTPSSTKSSDSDLTDKDLLKMLGQVDGLPSDIQAIFGNIRQLYELPGIGGMGASNLQGQYLQALQQVKIAAFNKKEYDKAQELVTKNDGLHEVAVTDQGKIVVMDSKGKIKQLSLEAYHSNRNKYQPLTNSQLLDYRAQNAPMDNTILGVVSNGVGLPQINKYIMSLLTKLGTSDLQHEGYSRTINGQIQQGAQFIQSLVQEGFNISGQSLDGLYKSGSATKTQVQQAKSALKWIYQTLPENMKTVLGFRTGSQENVIDLISTALSTTMDETRKFTSNMIEDEAGNKPGSKNSSSKEGKGDTDDKTNPILNIQNGDGGTYTTFKLNKGTQAEMSAEGTTYYSMIDQSGNTIQDTTLNNMLAQSGLQSIVDKTSISFGNQVLNPDTLDKVVYRNNGGTRVILPCEKQNGKIVPRFDILDKFNAIIQKVNQECTENTPAAERQMITAKYLEEAGLSELLQADGNYDMDKVQPFFIVDGYVTSKSFDKEANNDMLEEIEDDNTIEYIEKVLSPDDKHQYSVDTFSIFNPLDWFGYEKVYKGSIYIPIVSNNKLQAITGYGKDVKYNTGLQKEAEYQRFQRLQNIKQTSSSVL